MQAIESNVDTTECNKLPQLITSLPGPKAKKLIERDHAVLSPSYTRDYPLVARRARGAMVEDVDGNAFLDFAAGIAVVSTGHCHPESCRRHSEAGRRTDSHVRHGFLLSGHGGIGGEARCDRSGQRKPSAFISEIPARKRIEAAMKLARYHTGRDKFIAFHGCFHGRTMGALSLTASKAVQRKGFGALLAGVFHAPYPNTYRGRLAVIPKTPAADALDYIENELYSSASWIPKKWPQFSSNRFRAKAATSRARGIFARP